jgi:hypothetical protein
LTVSTIAAAAPAPPELSRAFALSHGQERLWLLAQLEPDDPAWNVATLVELRGELSPALLRAALAEVVRRHETLRTVFALEEGGPVAHIRRSWLPPMPVVDLAALPRPAADGEERRLAAAALARPFDLARGPLLRALLVRRTAATHILALVLHHIVCDAWSLGTVIEELGLLHEAGRRGQPPSLPALLVQYVDFAAWQRGALGAAAAARQLAYWRRQLGGTVPRLDLPRRPGRRTARGGVVRATLPTALVERLRAVGRAAYATWFMVLLAGFQALLARYSGQTDIVVGTPAGGRPRPEVEPLIGFFLNSLALRTDLAGNPGWSAVLARARATALDAFSHADLPFEALVAALDPERDLREPPFFQVLLNVLDLRGLPPSRRQIGGLEFAVLELPAVLSKLDLTLYARDVPAGVLCELVFAADLFEPVQAERLLGHLQTLLGAVAESPDLPLAALPLASEAERRQAALPYGPRPAAGPGTPAAVGEAAVPGTSPFGRFRRQVERAPASVALVSGGWHWTYGDLDRRAGRIGRGLAARVPAGCPVALLFDPGAPMIAAMLGALAAGLPMCRSIRPIPRRASPRC